MTFNVRHAVTLEALGAASTPEGLWELTEDLILEDGYLESELLVELVL